MAVGTHSQKTGADRVIFPGLFFDFHLELRMANPCQSYVDA